MKILIFAIIIALAISGVYYYSNANKNMVQTETKTEKKDIQVKITFQSMNTKLKVFVNNNEVLSANPDKLDDMADRASVTLINNENSVLEKPEARDNERIKRVTVLKSGDNTIKIDYQSLPDAEYSGLNLIIEEMARLNDDSDENYKLIYNVEVENKKEGSIVHNFKLPFEGEAVTVNEPK